jgi:hypothetical protein
MVMAASVVGDEDDRHGGDEQAGDHPQDGVMARGHDLGGRT